MVAFNQNEFKLEVNGVGRFGNLTVWQHLARKLFSRKEINIERQTGTSSRDNVQHAGGNPSFDRATKALMNPDASDQCKECTVRNQIPKRNDRWDLFKKIVHMGGGVVLWVCMVLTFCLIWGLATDQWEIWERFSRFVLNLIGKILFSK